MLECDYSCLIDVYKCMYICLFGLGVLVGIVYVVDCDVLVKDFGFSIGICNSLDFVLDCDYVLELFLSVLISMVYFFCFVEDLIFFNSGELVFLEFFDCVILGFLLML